MISSNRDSERVQDDRASTAMPAPTNPELTLEQQAVVDLGLDGPWLVDAGAGTGKTFTLVNRARALIERGLVKPSELLVVTFTNAAASEIAERLDRELDPASHDRPTCGTFHGIAGALLREFAYEAGSSPELRQIDDGRARGVFHRAFADLVAGRLGVDLSSFPLLERMSTLERSLATMAIGLKSKGVPRGEAIARARGAASYLQTIDFGALNKVVRGGLSTAVGWPLPSPPRTDDERHREAEREQKNIEVVAALFARFDELLDADRLVLFGDVILRATKMVRAHAAIAATLRARWKHAIVDEFQDTNDVQVGFLEAIFGDDLRPVLAVGDVRQAIYEFGGARPQNIIEFRDRAKRALPLTENRRSVQPVLDVAYHALASLGGVAPELNSKLDAHRGDAHPSCVRLGIFSDPDALEREAACVAETIAGLIAGGVAPRRCAILLRAGIRAGVFAQALLSRGIAAQLFGGAGFFTAREIREVIEWLRLASDPTDLLALTATLQSAPVGLSDGAVAYLAREKTLARAALLDEIPAAFSARECDRLERFRRIARIVAPLTTVPLVEAVQRVILSSGAEISRIANSASAAQVRANLEKFANFTADFAKDRPLATIDDLIAELDEREEFEMDLPIAEIEGDRVGIMTIHKSKGLEWDHVFLADVKPGIFPGQGRGSDEVAVFDPRTGALALKHGVDGRPTLRWWLTKKPHNELGHVLDTEKTSQSEEFRLLYVALTRARDCIYVTGRTDQHKKESSCYAAVAKWAIEQSGSLEPHAIVTQAAAVVDPSSTSVIDKTALQLELFARLERAAQPLETTVARRGTLSYTAMDAYERCPRRARYQYVLGLPDFSDEAPALAFGDDAEPVREPRNPARYGRVLHRVLEWMTHDRIAGRARAIDDLLADACEEEGWSPTIEDRRTAAASLASAATLLATYAPIDAEFRFDVTLDDVALGGYIDLIARDERGEPVVFDYKTGRTAAKHYDLQFALYAYAVRDEFPAVGTRVLRIADEGVTLENVEPASFERLRERVILADVMASDEPRPGRQCTYCPYAQSPCDAAPAESANS